MRYKHWGVALILVAGLGSVVGLAGCLHRSAEQRAEWIVSKISGELSLTSEQRVKLEDIKQTFLDLRKSHQTERGKRLDEVKEVLLSDHLDATKVKALLAQRRKVVDENFDPVFSKVAEFHASLRPEQKQKTVELLQKFSSRWN